MAKPDQPTLDWAAPPRGPRVWWNVPVGEHRSACTSSTTTTSCARDCTFLLERQEDIEVVGESATAAEATARIPALRPDVAVLDGRLPDGSGIEVCRAVRAVDPTIKALILTSYDDDEALFAAIMAGRLGLRAQGDPQQRPGRPRCGRWRPATRSSTRR